MARFDSGWVKSYRLRYDHWLEQDFIAWAILMKLIIWANYEDSPENSKISLKRGQVLTSSLELSKKMKLGRQRIRRALDALQARAVINQQTNQHGTIITICNYDKFQNFEKTSTNERTNDQPTTNQRPTNDQPHIQELKKERTKESTYVDSPITRLDVLWNQECKMLSQVSKLTDKRKRFMKARLVENQDPAYWEIVFRRIAGSAFCRGEIERIDGQPPWVADFDWIMKPDNHVKVMEGRYDDRKPVTANSSQVPQLEIVGSVKRVRN